MSTCVPLYISLHHLSGQLGSEVTSSGLVLSVSLLSFHDPTDTGQYVCVHVSDKDQQSLSGIKPSLSLRDHTDPLQNSVNSQYCFLVSQPS